ncbi:hypothetical protein [Leptospira sp. id769339]|uniref:hypothetical protein n=1 Tax=Leptospira sp. id769339 TaxID=2864221 RepID=UPI00214BBC6C|nr:hypothetical protein [Leptospira sp. id769339]MCR1795366.1 hypothetical protein [Leptospira sp. id769339]
MTTSIEVREITDKDDLRIFQNINTLMVGALILRKATISLRYKEFRKQISISEPKRLSIKLIKIEHFKYFVCSIIGTEISSWIHEDLLQLEKEVLISEGMDENSPLMKFETISEIFDRASKSHDIEFILD